MPLNRRERSESYTYLQQRKRFKVNSSEDINLECTSLIPSADDHNTTKRSPWKGWKTLSNESSPQTKTENDFPPLSNGSIFDPWYTPEPIQNWADYMDEEEAQENHKPNFNKKQRFKRKLLLSDKSDKTNTPAKACKPTLTDKHRLAQRQKQIDFGKNTASYGRYITEKPRHCRDVDDPKTPDKFQVCSTRSWTGQVRCWRRKLHEWDPPNEQKDNIFEILSKHNAQENMNLDTKSSALSSSEDSLKNLNIDECLLQQKLFL